MRTDMNKHAWVFGGTGAIGSSVVRKLRALDVPTTFTSSTRQSVGETLAKETGASHKQLTFTDRSSLQNALDEFPRPSLICHCAAISSPTTLVELREDVWRNTLTVNAESLLWIVQWAAMRQISPLEIVVTGGLDRNQSLPLPVHYAATQGMLSALVMSLGHELGPLDVRINMVAFGIMEDGLSVNLGQKSTEDYLHFSALRRKGTVVEAANAVAWFGLENTYVQGKTISVNGGI